MNIRKSIKGISLVGFGLLLGAVSMGAMNINTNYDSATQYIKKIFLTTDGTDSGNNKIKLNGSNGSISMSGVLNIKEGNLKDSTIVSNDIKNGEVKNSDIASNAVGSNELQSNVDVNKCGNNQVLGGDGTCHNKNWGDGDTSSSNELQNLDEVLSKGNTANSNIDMNNNKINNLDWSDADGLDNNGNVKWSNANGLNYWGNVDWSNANCKVCIACSDDGQWNNMVSCDGADNDGWTFSSKDHCADSGKIALKFVCGGDSYSDNPPSP